uniref:Uncharacterized protein n=1 Tax=Nothoprocta perdicaria TaxID=30464 RepID=A0A8C7E8W9_NOTPE
SLDNLRVHCAGAALMRISDKNAARKFLYGSVEEYVEALAPYTTEPIMAVAERQLKQCTERLVQDEQALALLVVSSFFYSCFEPCRQEIHIF